MRNTNLKNWIEQKHLRYEDFSLWHLRFWDKAQSPFRLFSAFAAKPISGSSPPVVVIWRVDFSQIDKIDIGVSYSYLSICKANRICKTNYSFIIIPTFSIRVSIRAFSLIRSSSNSVSYYWGPISFGNDIRFEEEYIFKALYPFLLPFDQRKQQQCILLLMLICNWAIPCQICMIFVDPLKNQIIFT